MTRAVGVDLGGTNIALAVVDDHRVISRRRIPTPQGPDAVVAAIVEGVRGLDAGGVPVGVGAPGPVVDGVLWTAPNLPGFAEPVPLAEQLADALEAPVVVDNDATAGAVGEWVAGAGRGARFLLGVWLGTGVGGGLVLQGRPYRGAFGGAGEFGHMVVRQGGALCGCGRRGCIEAYAGRASMEQAVAAAAAKGRHTVLFDIMGSRGKERLTSGVWARALEKRDALAGEVLDDAVDVVAAGIGSVINLLDLDRVVLGGGLVEKLGQPFADRLADAARPYLLLPDEQRLFVVAELADDAGVVGAAALAAGD